MKKVSNKNLKAIRESLKAQLEHKGADVAHFETLIDDYCFYCEQEEKMQKDIEENGIILKDVKSSTGKIYDKENPCVKLATVYNKQKLAILKQLELTTNDNIGSDIDDEM